MGTKWATLNGKLALSDKEMNLF